MLWSLRPPPWKVLPRGGHNDAMTPRPRPFLFPNPGRSVMAKAKVWSIFRYKWRLFSAVTLMGLVLLGLHSWNLNEEPGEGFKIVPVSGVGVVTLPAPNAVQPVEQPSGTLAVSNDRPSLHLDDGFPAQQPLPGAHLGAKALYTQHNAHYLGSCLPGDNCKDIGTLADAASVCNAYGMACGGVTCTSGGVPCQVRAGSVLLESPSGEVAYLKAGALATLDNSALRSLGDANLAKTRARFVSCPG